MTEQRIMMILSLENIIWFAYNNNNNNNNNSFYLWAPFKTLKDTLQ